MLSVANQVSAECHYVKCRYAECRGVLSNIWLATKKILDTNALAYFAYGSVLSAG